MVEEVAETVVPWLRKKAHVSEVENGVAGLVHLNRANQTTTLLDILDLMMPKMDGFEFLARIKKEEV